MPVTRYGAGPGITGSLMGLFSYTDPYNEGPSTLASIQTVFLHTRLVVLFT